MLKLSPPPTLGEDSGHATDTALDGVLRRRA